MWSRGYLRCAGKALLLLCLLAAARAEEPTSPFANAVARADAKLREGDLGGAEAALQEAASIDGAAARTWWLLGQVRTLRGRYEESVEALDVALRLDPEAHRV